MREKAASASSWPCKVNVVTSNYVVILYVISVRLSRHCHWGKDVDERKRFKTPETTKEEGRRQRPTGVEVWPICPNPEIQMWPKMAQGVIAVLSPKPHHSSPPPRAVVAVVCLLNERRDFRGIENAAASRCAVSYDPCVKVKLAAPMTLHSNVKADAHGARQRG